MPAEPVGMLIGAARRRIKQAVGRRVRRFRLTPQQFWLLHSIQEGNARSLREMAERQRTDQPTASRVVAALVRRKLVRMDEDPDDRRRARLTCTAAGHAIAADMHALALEIRGAVVAGMDETEQELLRHGLRKVIENMDRLELGPEPRRARRNRGA
jgi:DNA-binding MarR family transcriptional regulator